MATEQPPATEQPTVIGEDHLARKNREACRAYYYADPKHKQQAKRRVVLSGIARKGRLCSQATLVALQIDVHDVIVAARKYIESNPEAPARRVAGLRILVANML